MTLITLLTLPATIAPLGHILPPGAALFLALGAVVAGAVILSEWNE